MTLLQMHQGQKSFGTKTLFQGASFAVNEGEHVGVIGPNGAGKTTLFKVLVDQEELDSGELIRAQKLRLGYLEQEAEWKLDLTSEEYLQENCLKPIWELKQLGLGLGLREEHFRAPLKLLSGGYRMRMKLLHLLGQEPNLMLLDEPTNFLDLESVLALENFLQGYTGAFLLISHDREFLRRTTDATLEVEGGDIAKFPGNIDDYFEQKEELRQVLAAQAQNLELKRKHMQSFVDRFRAKATKAKQAQSRLKQLDKMEKIELKDLPIRARIKIPPPAATGKEILQLKEAELGYGTQCILKNVNLRIERGQHVGVVGFNGAGKSTLLKSLAQRLPLLNGQLQLGQNVGISYFAQHVAEDLDLKDTVLVSLQSAAHRDVSRQEILNLAGSLLFSGDDVQKKVGVLSGGEKSRVALGQILLRRSPLLLLDEPTNHLDFDTVEAMTEALRTYPGTVVMVSHDRSFIGRVAKTILEIRDGSVETYPGTYDEYLWSLEKGALKERLESMQTTDKLSDKKQISDSGGAEERKFNYKEESKRLLSEIRERQKQLEQTEKLLEKLGRERDDINSKLIHSKGIEALELAKNLGKTSRHIEEAEAQMLVLLEELEAKNANLQNLKNANV